MGWFVYCGLALPSSFVAREWVINCNVYVVVIWAICRHGVSIRTHRCSVQVGVVVTEAGLHAIGDLANQFGSTDEMP